MVRHLLEEHGAEDDDEGVADPETIIPHLQTMRSVLEKGGHFSGINRKVQFKPSAWTSPAMVAAAGDDVLLVSSVDTRRLPRLRATRPKRTMKNESVSPLAGVGTVEERSGGTPALGSEFHEEVTELVVVVKWGGVLTHAGREQAVCVGARARARACVRVCVCVCVCVLRAPNSCACARGARGRAGGAGHPVPIAPVSWRIARLAAAARDVSARLEDLLV